MHKEQLFVVTNKHVVTGVVAGTFVLRRAVIKDGEKVVVPGEGYTIQFDEKRIHMAPIRGSRCRRNEHLENNHRP